MGAAAEPGTRLAPRRGSYGVDAPYLLFLPLAGAAFNVVMGLRTGRPWPFVGAAAFAFFGLSGLYASLRGKFVVWARLVDALRLRGEERVLDIGCGRGAVLMMVAQRLTTGRAVGVDLWRGWDQSGNAASATQRNAEAEGVGERVELHTADMTALPLESASFDVVVSNIAIHNIGTEAGRDKALDEAVRVLRPGGQLLITDIQVTRRYPVRLAELGLRDVTRRSVGWRMWWGGPWMATYLVTASKPAA